MSNINTYIGRHNKKNSFVLSDCMKQHVCRVDVYPSIGHLTQLHTTLSYPLLFGVNHRGNGEVNRSAPVYEFRRMSWKFRIFNYTT